MAWPPTTHQDAADEITSLRDGKGWASTLGGRQRIGEALRVSPLLWLAGRWYTAHFTESLTTTAPASSELRLLAFYAPNPRAIDRVGCEITTAGSAGQVARLAVYNADAVTGLPTTVLVDAGTVAVDTLGVKEVLVSATLHGLYWLGLTAQSGTFRALASLGLTFVGGSGTATGTAGHTLTYSPVDPTSALPDRTGVAPGLVAGITPVLGVRAV